MSQEKTPPPPVMGDNGRPVQREDQPLKQIASTQDEARKEAEDEQDEP